MPFFVLVGIHPGVPLDERSEDDPTWIREPFPSDTRDHGPLITRGHTPIPTARHYGNRVNIDRGAAFGGSLSTIVVEGRDVFPLPACERVPLRPGQGG